MENIRNRLRLQFNKNYDYEKIIKQLSKLTFAGIHKSYEYCDRYSFRQNEVTMDTPIYLGFLVLQLSMLHMYETYYDKLQPCLGQENIQLPYIDADACINVNTEDIIIDLKNLGDIFDFINLNENHEIFRNKNKKVIRKNRVETTKNIWIDEIICLRSKMYSFKCGADCKNKLKGVSKSQSKHIKSEEYKKCLDEKKYQKECDNYLLRSINREMYLQKLKKSTLSICDDKRCYESNIKILPGN